MLFANGYRYHMRSIGCPMSLDGYGLSNGYFGRYRHTRRNGGPLNSRRIRSRSRRLQGDQENVDNSSNVLAMLRNMLCTDRNTGANVDSDTITSHNATIILPGVLPLVSRKCLISMTSALFLLLFLGIISTMVGGVYFQRGNHPISFKDNIHQLLSIIAIICGIIMLLSSGVLFRVLFCKGKWNYSSSAHQRLIVAAGNSSHINNGSFSNFNETIINRNNEESFIPSLSFNIQLTHTNINDGPPTYSECNDSCNDLQCHIDFSTFNNNNFNNNDAIQPPPTYTSDPPPRYSQLDVRTVMVVIVPNESNQDDNTSFRDNAQESPLPAIESISSPNNNFNEIDTENILVIEDYKPC